MITNPAFRQLGSDVILLTRDIFADAASAAADQAKQAAESSRPSEKERKDGVDFDGMKKQGKATAKGLRTGKVQGEARENIWDEVEKAKQYFDEKLPEGEEARDKVIQRLQQVRYPIDCADDRSSRKRSRTRTTVAPSPPSSTCSKSTPTRPRTPSRRPRTSQT